MALSSHARRRHAAPDRRCFCGEGIEALGQAGWSGLEYLGRSLSRQSSLTVSSGRRKIASVRCAPPRTGHRRSRDWCQRHVPVRGFVRPRAGGGRCRQCSGDVRRHASPSLQILHWTSPPDGWTTSTSGTRKRRRLCSSPTSFVSGWPTFTASHRRSSTLKSRRSSITLAHRTPNRRPWLWPGSQPLGFPAPPRFSGLQRHPLHMRLAAYSSRCRRLCGSGCDVLHFPAQSCQFTLSALDLLVKDLLAATLPTGLPRWHRRRNPAVLGLGVGRIRAVRHEGGAWRRGREVCWHSS